MSISVEDLVYGTEKKYGIRPEAGAAGLHRRVRWVHLVEDRQVADTLMGNEFIFTTGVGNITSDSLIDYVRQLQTREAGGLCLSLGRYYPELPPDLIRCCDEAQFPLFSIPCTVPLVEVTYDFCNKIIRKDRLDINVAENFRNVILNPGNSEACISQLTWQGYTDENYKVFALAADDSLGDDRRERLRMDIKFLIKRYIKRVSAFELNGDIAIVCHRLDDETSGKVVQDYLDFCAAHSEFHLSLGESQVADGIAAVSEAWQEARTALKAAKSCRRRHMLWSEVGIYGLLLAPNREGVLRNYYQRYLEPLVLYDAQKGTDYTEILRLYLANQSSVSEVAQQSYLHRNTINYRLSRIREILGIEMDDEDKMNLRLAFLIRELM